MRVYSHGYIAIMEQTLAIADIKLLTLDGFAPHDLCLVTMFSATEGMNEMCPLCKGVQSKGLETFSDFHAENQSLHLTIVLACPVRRRPSSTVLVSQ